MTNEVFFLSIQQEYVRLLLDGSKKWELRENPNFGILPGYELSRGDVLFIVSVSERMTIPCLGLVEKILRGDDYLSYFQDHESGHWLETGCSPDSPRDWSFFEDILHEYSTAVRLDTYRLDPPFDVTRIRHNTRTTAWSGRGFTPAKELKRFSIDGRPIASYFDELARIILGRDPRV